MSEILDDLQKEASRPRPIFLVVAAFVSFAAVGAYVYEESIVEQSGALVFAVLLVSLVIIAMCLVLCYRIPRLGNRLLGYDIVIVDPDKKVKSGVQYSGGFKVDGGTDIKRQNSKRKSARYSRKKYAEVTRQMQQDSETDTVSSPENKD